MVLAVFLKEEHFTYQLATADTTPLKGCGRCVLNSHSIGQACQHSTASCQHTASLQPP
jgi:hypothetical protein